MKKDKFHSEKILKIINKKIDIILILVFGALLIALFIDYNSRSSTVTTVPIVFDVDKKSFKDSAIYSSLWGLENITQVTESEFVVQYPKGSYKPSANPRGGAGFIYKFLLGLDHVRLSYDVKFDETFDFVKGGKLPGFCGGSCPRGGSDKADGFSTRFMWRQSGDFEVYAYLPSDTGTIMGKSIGRGMYRFETGKYYTLSQEIQLNTPGEANGKLYVYVDNQLIYKEDGLIYRNNNMITIDQILFSTFFGGSDTSWATPIDTSASFKDFRVSY